MSRRQQKQKPFPWYCPTCGQRTVRPRATSYTASVKHDGKLHTVTIDDLGIPTCESCDEKVFSGAVDDRISAALRAQLGLLSPEEIRDNLAALGVSQKEAASHLRIAEETLSRWVTGTVIQSQAMDKWLRAYFSIADVRQMLAGEHAESIISRCPVDPDVSFDEQQFPRASAVYGMTAMWCYAKRVSRRKAIFVIR